MGKTFEEWYVGIEWWTKIGPNTKEQKLKWFDLYRSLYG